MLKSFLLIFLTLSVISCQTNRNFNNQTEGRSVATGEVWNLFLRQFASKSKMSTESIEEAMIKYFKDKASNNNHGNYVSIGITNGQAQRITSLSSDLSYMPKVRKWGMENMDKIFPHVSKDMMADVYETVVVANRGIMNRYKMSSKSEESASRIRQRKMSPTTSLSEKQEDLLKNIASLDDKKIKATLRENLSIIQTRGERSPSVMANGQEIVESAALITQKTGIAGIGKGCQSFMKNTSPEVLEIKANIDIYRASLIEEMAYARNGGRKFASISEVPEASRLKQGDIDEATRKSFREVMGYTDPQAAEAVRVLKAKPCAIY